MGTGYGTSVESARKLGKEIYNEAKMLSPTTSDPYKGTTYGERLKTGGAPKLKSRHKTNPYEGMIRQEKTYAANSKRAVQSQYTTFRTISENPDSIVEEGGRRANWIRPATPGVHLAGEVASFTGRLASASFAAYIEGVSGG
jgi:hypothetical protein